MSIKVFNDVQKYSKNKNTNNFQALIDLMQKKENALDYLAQYKNGIYKDIIATYKAVSPMVEEITETDAEKYAINYILEGKPTIEQKEKFLHIISNSEPSKNIKLSTQSYEIIRDLYFKGFFDDISQKKLFEFTTGNSKLYSISALIFEKNPSIISNEEELVIFLKNQMEGLAIKGMQEMLYEELNKKIKIRHSGDPHKLSIERKIYLKMLERVDLFCEFDPSNAIKKIDRLSRIKDTVCELENKDMYYQYFYTICFIENLTYEDLRYELNMYLKNVPSRYDEFKTNNVFEACYDMLQKDPIIFNEEQTALSLLKIYIQNRNRDFNFEILEFVYDANHVKYKNLDFLAVDPEFNAFIDELKQKLTVDIVEVLKNDPQLSKLYEVQTLRNQLSNF